MNTLDQFRQPLSFRLRKALRYVRLYGPARTLIKVRGKSHMTDSMVELPANHRPATGRQRVALVGCGNFAFSNIAYYLRKNFGAVIRGAIDSSLVRAGSLAAEYDASYYGTTAQEILDDPDVRLVYVASNHASHAEYAIAALQKSKHVHVEKPHVVDMGQLQRLCRAMVASRGVITSIGYNRPVSHLGRQVEVAVGTQSGPVMINWFITGHVIDADHWYFDPVEGGRVLGNLCHWIDFTRRLVPEEGRYPVTIRPTRSAKPDSDIAVTYVFGNGSIAAITFSAMGHAFEGVRERLSLQRGDMLVYLDDFQRLTIDNLGRKRTLRSRYREQGHEASICNSYRAAQGNQQATTCSLKDVWEAGELFLRTKEALDTNASVTVEAFTPDRLD